MKKCIKILGLALIVLFALSAVASSVAMAEPELLPAGSVTTPIKFNSKSIAGTTPLIETTSGKKLSCEKGTAKGSFTSATAGTVTSRAEGCKEPSTGAKCSSNEVAGVVEGEGPIKLVTVLPTAVLDLGVWGEPLALGGLAGAKDLKLICGVLSVLVLRSAIGVLDLKGASKLELLTSLQKAKTVVALSHQKGGEQEIKKCDEPKAFCEGKEYFQEVQFKSGEAHQLMGGEGEAEIEFEKEVEVHF